MQENILCRNNYSKYVQTIAITKLNRHVSFLQDEGTQWISSKLNRNEFRSCINFDGSRGGGGI